MVVAEAALALLAIGLGRVVDVHPLAGMDLDVRGLAWGVLATAPLLLGLLVCTRIRSGPPARLLELVRERIRPLFAGCSAGDLALIALSAGIGEELLFRGLIQPGLAVWLPAWAALAITSVLFGLAHFVTLTYSLLAGLIGLYLGALLLVSDNLLAPVLVHALYDLAALHLLIRLKPASARSVV